jgi:membrane-associated phospholipid phosphatase
VWQHWNSPKAKTASSTLSIATISIVAFDRIYLNVHWFSDVVGGLLLGIFWLTLTLWIFRYAEKTEKIHEFKFLGGAGTLKTRMSFSFKKQKANLIKENNTAKSEKHPGIG